MLRKYVLPHTFEEIVSAVGTYLREFAQTDAARQPLFLAAHVYAAANELAGDTWSYFAQKKSDITMNQSTGLPFYWYRESQVKKPAVVTCLWGDGSLHYLGIMTPTEMDATVGIKWRDNAQAEYGNPIYFVYEPCTSWQLYPRPNYITECYSGVTIDGWLIPGEQWNPSLPPDDPGQDTARCPLPDFSHIGVVYGAMLSRCAEIANPDALSLIKMWTPFYLKIKGQLASQALNSPSSYDCQYDGAPGAACGYIYDGGTGIATSL